MTAFHHPPAGTLAPLDLVRPPADPRDEPGRVLAALGKDSRLVPYGDGNFGMPLALLERGLIVPTERFFLRANGSLPAIDPERWSLTIGGMVERPLRLRLRDLQAMPQRSVTAFLECAGNGRARFEPLPEGVPWRDDAVGNAVWEGVPLGSLLRLAGVAASAVDLVARGADEPEMRRGLPLTQARDPDVLLVLRMNGAPLPAAHGGPVRLLVPGWAGIASTKWLVGIEILDHAFAGRWNADNYVIRDRDGTPLRPMAEMPVKSLINAPRHDDLLPAGWTTIAGYAWSGYGAVDRVEVSVDGGASWREAALERAGRRSWARFHLAWNAAPGRHRLLARATDERGLRQPPVAAWNGKGYGQNSIQAVEVTVAAESGERFGAA